MRATERESEPKGGSLRNDRLPRPPHFALHPRGLRTPCRFHSLDTPLFSGPFSSSTQHIPHVVPRSSNVSLRSLPPLLSEAFRSPALSWSCRRTWHQPLQPERLGHPPGQPRAPRPRRPPLPAPRPAHLPCSSAGCALGRRRLGSAGRPRLPRPPGPPRPLTRSAARRRRRCRQPRTAQAFPGSRGPVPQMLRLPPWPGQTPFPAPVWRPRLGACQLCPQGVAPGLQVEQPPEPASPSRHRTGHCLPLSCGLRVRGKTERLPPQASAGLACCGGCLGVLGARRGVPLRKERQSPLGQRP